MPQISDQKAKRQRSDLQSNQGLDLHRLEESNITGVEGMMTEKVSVLLVTFVSGQVLIWWFCLIWSCGKELVNVADIQRILEHSYSAEPSHFIFVPTLSNEDYLSDLKMLLLGFLLARTGFLVHCLRIHVINVWIRNNE